MCTTRQDRGGYDVPTLLQLTGLEKLRFWAAGDESADNRLDCRQLKVGIMITGR